MNGRVLLAAAGAALVAGCSGGTPSASPPPSTAATSKSARVADVHVTGRLGQVHPGGAPLPRAGIVTFQGTRSGVDFANVPVPGETYTVTVGKDGLFSIDIPTGDYVVTNSRCPGREGLLVPAPRSVEQDISCPWSDPTSDLVIG